MLRTLSEALGRQSRLEERIQELERTLEHGVPPALPVSERGLPPAREADIRAALRDVLDPEMGTNVVDLGLIREIARNGRGVEVRMVLTHSDCPLAGHLVEQVRRKVKSVAGDEQVEVVLADEVWSWADAAPDLPVTSTVLSPSSSEGRGSEISTSICGPHMRRWRTNASRVGLSRADFFFVPSAPHRVAASRNTPSPERRERISFMVP